MSWEEVRPLPGVPAPVARALLERRPAGWLRPFLQLAARRADERCAARPTFRLLLPTGSDEQRLTWDPCCGAPLFTRFSGTIGVRSDPATDGSELVLRGWGDGGDPEVGVRAVATLADLLAGAAIAAALTAPGG